MPEPSQALGTRHDVALGASTNINWEPEMDTIESIGGVGLDWITGCMTTTSWH